jgi:hypothetical protein
MVEDIQIERQREADLGRLAKTGKSAGRFQERVGHFLTTFGSKEKKEVQPFSSATSSTKA